MKKLLLLTLFFLSGLSVFSQKYDIMVTTTGDRVVCKVLEVSTNTVTYKTLINGDWQTYECGADCLEGIYYNAAYRNQFKYEDGTMNIVGIRKLTLDSSYDEEMEVSVQEQILPAEKTLVSLGAGFGYNYGGLGVKTILGYNNSGLLLGAGRFSSSIIGYEIGAQYSFQPFYVSVNYGVVTTYEADSVSQEPVYSLYYMLGGFIPLGKGGNYTLDTGFGFSPAHGNQKNTLLCFHVGVMYHFPYKAGK